MDFLDIKKNSGEASMALAGPVGQLSAVRSTKSATKFQIFKDMLFRDDFYEIS